MLQALKMSSNYWASSEDLSVESSSGGLNSSRDQLPDDHSSQSFEDIINGPQGDLGALTRLVASDLSRPHVQQTQHASFFYLALIEARCRKQAALFLNTQRSQENQLPEDHPDVCALAVDLLVEAKRELANVGLLPEELVGRHIPELPSYLSSFDAAINNIARRTTSDLSSLPHVSFVDSQSLSLVPETSSLQQAQGYPNALVRQDFRMAPAASQHGEPSFFAFLSPNNDGVVPRSIYGRDYQQLSTLGTGGFGTVYLARFSLDNNEYAIKQIAVPAGKFRGASGRTKLQQVLAEVQSLAKLIHPNIVRYYHAWLEERNRTKDDSGDDTESGNDSDSDSDLSPESLDDVTNGMRSIQLGLENSVMRDVDRKRANSLADEKSRDYIEFGDSNQSKSAVNYKSAFRQPGEPSSDDEDDDDSSERNDSTEEVLRSDNPKDVVLYEAVEKEVVLHIKMFAYPLSLEDFIWGAGLPKHSPIKHCFHTLPAIRLLLAILDGTEYLHRKGFIHRDLKPPNIFLSILEPEEPPTHHFINISDCKKCDTSGDAIHICPHIGDFGLIHDLKVVTADPAMTPSKKKEALEPFPFSAAATQQAGTKFYCPTNIPKENPICAKLDVYSFGVIAFEMVYEFGTKSERAHILTKLRDGVYPENFEKHTLYEGIKAMLCQDRDERWSCKQVREWLNQKLKEESGL
ncbi:hypothetical protein VTL71DRAFT_13820 [Oculimacula yallundae]|uniref:non-specific serine/threonine protein kinase n=1 Tax=Oculimacula yallundae TaxID=86028 RepID=A0ABR4CLI5_9HELO